MKRIFRFLFGEINPPVPPKYTNGQIAYYNLKINDAKYNSTIAKINVARNVANSIADALITMNKLCKTKNHD